MKSHVSEGAPTLELRSTVRSDGVAVTMTLRRRGERPVDLGGLVLADQVWEDFSELLERGSHLVSFLGVAHPNRDQARLELARRRNPNAPPEPHEH